MSRFRPVIVDFENDVFQNTEYLSTLFFLYVRYAKFLDDDFALNGRSLYKYFLENVAELSPYFWVVMDEIRDEPAGFVYLDNITGCDNRLYSAEVSACFFKKYWGGFTLDTAKKFFDVCFEALGLRKLKALIYSQNFRVKTLLKRSGFEKEATLKAETIAGGKLQDIEIYSLIKER